MKVTHRHVAQGSNNPEKQVSLDRWNDAHRIFAALAGTLPEDTGELVIRKTGPRSIELVLRDDDGVDRTFPIDPIASTRTFDQFAGSNMDGLLAGMKVTAAQSPRFAGAWRHRDLGNVIWYFAFAAMVLTPNVFTIADRQTCAQVAIDRATAGPRQDSAAYGQFTLVTFPSGKVFFCNIPGTTGVSAPSDTGVTLGSPFLGDGSVTWEWTGLQVPTTWQWVILDVDTGLLQLRHPDSNDAYAAMLAALCETSGVDAAWLNTASAHPGQTRMGVINALIQNNMTDELSGTSPGPRLAQTFQHGVKGNGDPYADVRFLADNVEVWRGYRAQSALLARLSLSTAAADQNAADVKAGVLSLHVGGRFQRFEGQDPDHLAIGGDEDFFSDWRYYMWAALHGMLSTLAEWQTYADAVLADTRANVPGLFTAALDDFPMGEWYLAVAERMGIPAAAETHLNRVTKRAPEFVPIVDAAIAIHFARRPAPEQQAGGGGGGGATNLGYVAGTRTITSDTGTDAVLPLAGSDPGLMSAADKTKLDAITGANTGDQTSIVGITGTKAQFNTAVTDGNFLYVGDAIPWTDVSGKPTFATVATSGAYSDLSGLPSLFSGVYGDLSGIPATFTPAAHAHPASDVSDFAEAVDDRVAALLVAGTNITLTYNDAGNSLTIDASGGGGGSPGGASGEIQYNNGGAFAGAADVEIEGGQLRLPAIATPSAPVADGVKVFGREMGGHVMPAMRFPTGRALALQASLSDTQLSWWQATGNGSTDTQSGFLAGSTGTSTAVNVATTNFRTRMRWREWLVTTASTTAIASFRGGALSYTVGAASAGQGGFYLSIIWSPATGVTNASHRSLIGMRATIAAPSDVEPSSLLNICGVGYDAADTNMQFMHNNGSGTATKVDLGASFPKPSADRTKVYQLQMYAPPGTTQSVSYLLRDLETGAEANGTVTTDLPSTTTLLGLNCSISVGGVSSVVGLGVRQMVMETDY